VQIACIIEGDGEEDALPVLLRRIIAEIDPVLYVDVSRPWRYPRGRLRKREDFSAFVGSVASRLSRPAAMLILLDADDDCPASLGQELLGWARAARSDIPCGVVAANREYEAWFLAAAESLRGLRGLRSDLVAPFDCEAIRDAKGWLRDRAAPTELYDPVRHQASFSAQMDLALARERSRSFRKLEKEVQALIAALQTADA
jgi:hypothetical protein